MTRRRAVLVTRPLPGLTETLAQVETQGWDALPCPMLRITPAAPLPPQEAEIIAVTSANALEALRLQPKDRLLLAVGEKTAERARKAGFLNIRAASGDAASLAALCRREGLTGRKLLLACGRGYGVELAQELGARRVEVYAAQRIASLPEAARHALLAEAVEAVLFYSGETAGAFMDACDTDVRAVLKRVRALCLSAKIASRLEGGGACPAPALRWRMIGRSAPLETLGTP